MAASTSSTLSPNGPFNCQAPETFAGRKEHFEEFSLNFKANLSLMSTNFKKAVDNVEENLELEVVEEY